jgi:hypothetical protein
MGKKGGSGNSQTVYQKAEPWEGAKPLAKGVMDFASTNLAEWFKTQNPDIVEGWKGPTLAGFNNDQLNTMNKIKTFAGNQENLDPLRNASGALMSLDRLKATDDAMLNARDKLINPTINGAFLNANPYRDDTIRAATRPMQESLDRSLMAGDADAVASGRYGSRLWNENRINTMNAAQRNMGDVGAQISNAQYNQERANQFAAASAINDAARTTTSQMALGNQTFDDWLGQNYKQFGLLQSVGDQQQQMSQLQLDDAKNRALERLWMPYNLTAAMGNLAFTGGQMGGQTSTTTPMYMPSFGQQLLGAGQMGMGAYGMANSMGLGQYSPYIGLLTGGLSMMG